MTFLGQPWYYWLGFWFAAAVVVAVPLSVLLERRNDQADREAWERRNDQADREAWERWQRGERP
jgi:hypothetical protein